MHVVILVLSPPFRFLPWIALHVDTLFTTLALDVLYIHSPLIASAPIPEWRPRPDGCHPPGVGTLRTRLSCSTP